MDENVLSAFIDYAKAVSENAVRSMERGFVAPYPRLGACEYCDFKAVCKAENILARKIGSVNDETIEKAVENSDFAAEQPQASAREEE